MLLLGINHPPPTQPPACQSNIKKKKKGDGESSKDGKVPCPILSRVSLNSLEGNRHPWNVSLGALVWSQQSALRSPARGHQDPAMD